MIKNELKSLWNNKLLLLVLFVIMLIPAIYAGLFLASMWDPYGDLQYLPVAVVNEDEPVAYQEKELHVGEDLANNLKDNNSMAFHVVDKATANEGLLDGTYYMVVTIPKDFSKNASTVMDEKPKKMILDYETNPGKNYISMKLGESAMKEIKSNLTEEISKTYAETIFDSIQMIGDGFDDAIDGTNQMIEGEDELVKGNETITDNLGVLAQSSLTFKEGTNTLTKGITTYTNGVSTVDKGIDTLSKGANQLSKRVVPGTKKLSEGANSLQDGIKSYTKGVESASQGTTQLKAGSEQLLVGMQTIQKQMNSKLTTENINNMKALSQQALPGIRTGINQLYQGVCKSDLSALSSLEELAPGIESAGKYAASANGTLEEAKSKVNETSQNLTSAKTKLERAQKMVQNLDDQQISEESKREILAALNEAENSIVSAATNLGKEGVVKQIGTAQTNLSGTTKTLSGIGTALGGMNPQSLQKISKITDGVEQLEQSAVYLDTASEVIDSLVGSMTSVQAAFNATQESSGSSGLVEGMMNLDKGILSLDSGLNTLVANNKKLTNGATTLVNGTNSLYNGLNSGVGSLNQGVEKLSNGTKQLVKNNDSLIQGANQLLDGATRISAGAGKLQDGSKTMGEGLLALKDGTVELNEAMVDGEKEIREQKASDDNISMFASPVELNETQITKVENNGHAMAAYMFSVGLWVGCLAFCLMYPIAGYKGKLTSGREWWASKAVILYPLGFMMVVLLLLILHSKIGFNPASMSKTFIVGISAVAAFMAIMFFFNLLLGKVGSFLMLVFMVLQLAGSAGTYPVEISGPLANVLHKWVPFTYSVDAFRAAIAENGTSILPQCGVLIAISIIFTVMTLVLFEIRARKTFENKVVLYDWLEEKGLA